MQYLLEAGLDAGCIIPDTAIRAITIEQIEHIVKHMQRRLEKEEGQLAYTPNYAGAKERTITRMEDINLYDCNTLLLKPATKVLHHNIAPQPDATPKPSSIIT